MTAETFGKRVYRLRTDAGLSQLELSLRCDSVSQAHIGDIERGEKAPTITTMSKIAYGFGMTLAELIGEDEPQVEYAPSINKIIAYSSALTEEQRKFAIEFLKLLVKHPSVQ